ncbi:Bone marrow stromal antigen 2 [Lemmus lemmus]
MAPTFYHYPPMPMEKTWEEQGPGIRRRRLVVAVLIFLITAVLVTLLIYFAVRANSRACRDGLRAEEEWRNTTHLLQRQLTRAQENLLQAETQTNTCNRTVVRLETVPSKAPSDWRSDFETAKHVPRQRLRTLKSRETLKLPTALKSGASVSSLPELGGGLQILWRVLELKTLKLT